MRSAFYKNEDGYTLLVGILIISAVLLMFALTLSSGLGNRQGSGVSIENNMMARALAEGCMEAAFLERSIDVGWGGNRTIAFGDDTCTIMPIINGDPITIQTEATKNDSTVRLQAQVNENGEFDIVSWQRVAEF